MKKYNLVILIFLLNNIYSTLISSELIIDVFGKEEVKTYAIDDNNFFKFCLKLICILILLKN